MSSQFKERLSRMLHPYAMVLRQGHRRPEDPFDYSLTLLYIHSREKIRAPKANQTLSDLQHASSSTESALKPVKATKKRRVTTATPRKTAAAKKVASNASEAPTAPIKKQSPRTSSPRKKAASKKVAIEKQ